MVKNPQIEILVATHNPGKVREIKDALSAPPVKLVYLEKFPNLSPVNETGESYQENAVLKAISYARATGVCTLSDDSGLEIERLGGKPGPFSARFGGEEASDASRINILLEALSKSSKDRRARFVCCMALAGWSANSEQGPAEPRVLIVTEATCEGQIALAPSGTNGFGFDPIFVPTGYDATFAELPLNVKYRISHRAKALRSIRRFLGRWLRASNLTAGWTYP